MKALLPLALLAALALPFAVRAQEVVPDTVTFVKAEVTDIVSSRQEYVFATEATTTYQTLKVRILDGEARGQSVTVDNDYLLLKAGDAVYLRHTVNRLEGIDTYVVSEPYRLPVLWFFGGLFLVCLFIFGGKQGLRGLVSLGVSLLCIGYLLLPGILAGYSPILLSVGIASIIVVAGSYITHGFNKTTTAAVLGMLATIAITGALAYSGIHAARLSGYSNEETVYLNFNTHGTIDFVGLLFGGIMIGLLGVLYDAAIGQAVAVEELLAIGGHVSRGEIVRRALRIGREHIGALVNILAIAYVGASLPLLLLFEQTVTNPAVTINQELFATEILRTAISSTGLILAVPLTTFIAVWMLRGRTPGAEHQIHRH